MGNGKICGCFTNSLRSTAQHGNRQNTMTLQSLPVAAGSCTGLLWCCFTPAARLYCYCSPCIARELRRLRGFVTRFGCVLTMLSAKPLEHDVGVPGRRMLVDDRQSGDDLLFSEGCAMSGARRTRPLRFQESGVEVVDGDWYLERCRLSFLVAGVTSVHLSEAVSSC